jgi:ATP-binding cassette subfamily B protein
MSGEYHIEDEVQEKAIELHIVRRLLRYVRPHRRAMVVATVLLLAATAVSTVIPMLDMYVIDHYINDPARTGAHADGHVTIPANPDPAIAAKDRAGLGRLIGFMALLMAAEMAIRYLQTLIVTFVGQKTMLDMRMQIFAHLQRLSLRFHDRNPVGRLMTRVTNDVENIQDTIVGGLVQIIGDVATIFFVLAVMLWMNWKLALITLSTVPPVFVASYIFQRYARVSYLEIRRKIASVNAHMQETITGMAVVQIFGHEDRSFEKYRESNADHRDEWFRTIHYFAVYWPVVDGLGALAIALIVLFGGRQILTQADMAMGVASIGMLNAYVQWADRMFGPIRALADRYNMIQAAMASSERVFTILDTPEDIVNKPGAISADGIQGRVEFKNVWFAYEPDVWVLKDVSFTIEPGERVAIVGHTGAGKSTLSSLLSRFYDVQRGSITVDGVDVRDYDKDSLRRNIGMVLQDVFLFSGSVDHNIRLGNEELSGEWVRECADYVNAARFIERLPEQYQYDVGERGGNISTGQRQLLAFARTLAHRPKILVLDEATSSVDTETEALIQDAIAKLMQGRTAIVVAHRLSTVQHADRIVVMHHGQIREIGTHQELLARRGIYHTLYQLQYKDQSHVA